MKTKINVIGLGQFVLLFAFFANTTLAQMTKQIGSFNTSEITGKVYFDENNNGLMDANDFGLPYQTVSVLDDQFIAITNELGDYKITVTPGTYTIVAKLSNFQKLTTTDQTAQLKSGERDIDNNFGIAPTASISDLKVSLIDVNTLRPGALNTIELIYTNIGAPIAEGQVCFIKDRNFIFEFADISPTKISGDTLIWSVTLLKPFLYERIKINLKLADTFQSNTLLNSVAKISANNIDVNPSDNIDFLSQSVATGSIVLNSKKVEPNGVVKTFSAVPSNVSLVYTIRFQNTTGSLANQIIIIDTLTTKLSPGTFTLVGASHACSIQFSVNVLTFEFLNINLPDSATNFNGSMGWVQFIINTANNMSLNDSVKNVADIYFDYNAAIRTSEARVDFVNVSAIDEYNRTTSVQVFPNPFDHHFNLKLDKPCFDCSFELIDLMGKTILKQTLNSDTYFSFEQNNLAAGFYVYKISQQNKVVETGKLIAR